MLQPLGQQFPTGPGPFGLAVSPSGNVIVTANIGPELASATVLESNRHDEWTAHNYFASPASGPEADWRSLSSGIAFASEKSVWLSEGDSGRVRLVETGAGTRKKLLDLNGPDVTHSFAGSLAYDSRRSLLCVLDPAHFRLVVFDARRGVQLASVATGFLPLAIALSPDGNQAWVANIGHFRYPAAAITPPNLAAPESNSVCQIDLSQPENPKVLGFVRTGLAPPPDIPIVGGSSPSGILATSTAVYVSNAHSDTVDVLDPATRAIRASIALRIPGLEALRGIVPIGMALDDSRHWLLVAEAGINALAVIDTASNRVLGHIPVGWFPSAVAIRQGSVIVANVKGRGTGPSSILVQPDMLEFPNVFGRGSVSRFPLPAEAELPKLTKLVLAANGFLPDVRPPGPKPLIRHVVVIVKEDRAFDEIFGDLQSPAGNVAGSPRLARYGEHGYAPGGKDRFSLQHVNVTPNHRALAARFTAADNFYADSDGISDGHHWLTGVYPDAWTETVVLAAGAPAAFRMSEDTPGRLLMSGDNAAVHPEELPQAGSLWDHLERHGTSFRNFGEALLPPALAAFIPTPGVLERNTSRAYPGFNTGVSDQFRASTFIAEVNARYAQTGKALPAFIFIRLPNDHTAEPRPATGYPYAASYVADNDLALGRIVEYLSHSLWWKETVLFITEDDARGGRDHIDAHRTVLLAAGPYVRRNYVSHVNASFPSILKTAFWLLDLPPLNLFDAAASDFRDLFTGNPDFSPFDAVPEDPRLFDPALVR